MSYPSSSQGPNGPGFASLQHDPFLTRPDKGHHALPFGGRAPAFGEEQPLTSSNGITLPPRRLLGEKRALVLPLMCCFATQTFVSILALGLSFDETGHKDGYEDGHSDSVANSDMRGCESVFWWMAVQATVDLAITFFTCLFFMNPLKTEPGGIHGGAATVRLCTIAAGFHLLYFSGLKRNVCDPFLLVWSTIVVWSGIAIMLVAICCLLAMLSGVAGNGHPRYRYPPRMPQMMKHPPGVYQTTYQPQGSAPRF